MSGPSPTVIWLGKRALDHPGIYHSPSQYRTHAPDCPWALSVEAKRGECWPRVPAASVPAGAPRCSKCGGGR